MAIERTTSKAKIEVISMGGHLACKILRVVESLILVSVLNGFLDHVFVSRLYPKQEHKKRKKQSTTVQCASNMMQTWYAMRDAICDAYARFAKE